ncbi:MAG: hypothetical protein GQE15_01125 [Archangiaceae bacterium]|nr:hypothetical protein [Archangiaceae bacterium]
MSANQPPSPAPSPGPAAPPPGGNRGALIAIVGVVAVVGIVVGIMEARSKGTTPPKDGPISGLPGPTSQPPDSAPTGAFDSPNRPEPVYGAMEEAPAVENTPELFWLDVHDPKAVHQTLRSNAWLGKALKDPVGQGFIAAWGGFFGTRGEDIGKVFTGAVADLVLDQVLATRYRIVWYGGEGAKGAPAVVIPNPSAAANGAFDTLVKVAASGGFNPPSCVTASEANDAGAVPESIHRVVLADKILFAARLKDRIVLAPRPQAAMLAMCKELPKDEPRAGVAVSLGFSMSDSGRGAQGFGAMLGLDNFASLDFAAENDAFVPKGLAANAAGGGRLAAVAPSQELLKAIPEKSGVVLFLAVKLPKELTATALRDTLGEEGEDFNKTRKTWELGEPRQAAVIWNPRGNKTTEVAVLWGKADDEKALAEAMTKGNGALQTGKACGVLAYASTKELMADLQSACAGKKPSMLQASQAVVKGVSQNTSLSLTVNLGRVLSQLTLDGWLSEHPAPNATTGPQEIEAARKLLEELPTVGFTATVGSDGKIVSGGFRS